MLASTLPTLEVSKIKAVWPSIEQQMDTVRERFGAQSVPAPTQKVRVLERAGLEQPLPLLHTSLSIHEIVQAVRLPDDWTMEVDISYDFISNDLRVGPYVQQHTKPLWVAFDPVHGHGERPGGFWTNHDVATTEVLSALVVCPEWSMMWSRSVPAPTLAGYRHRGAGNWDYVPYLRRDESNNSVVLTARALRAAGDIWASPLAWAC